MWPSSFFEFMASPSRLVWRVIWTMLSPSLRHKISIKLRALDDRSLLQVPRSSTLVYAIENDIKSYFANSVLAGFESSVYLGARTAMPYSLIATCFNEACSCSAWLQAIADQTVSPAEVIICDGGSVDGTPDIIHAWVKHYNQTISPERQLNFKIIHLPGANIAQGRNYAIRDASCDIVICSDFGSEPDSMWAELLLVPFRHRPDTEVSMGWYEARVRGIWAKHVASFIVPRLETVVPETFLPSARALAFKKECWNRAGGFPEYLSFAGEDTLFGYYLKFAAARWAFVPEAKVVWHFPKSPVSILKMVARYAQGDAEGGKVFIRRYMWLLRHGFALILESTLLLVAALLYSYGKSDKLLFVLLLAGLIVLTRVVVISMPYRVFSDIRTRPFQVIARAMCWIGLVTAQFAGFLRGLLERERSEQRKFNQLSIGYCFVITHSPLFDSNSDLAVKLRVKDLLINGWRVVNIYLQNSVDVQAKKFDHPLYEDHVLNDFNRTIWLAKHNRYISNTQLQFQIADGLEEISTVKFRELVRWLSTLRDEFGQFGGTGLAPDEASLSSVSRLP